jgi:hypothetical protein
MWDNEASPRTYIRRREAAHERRLFADPPLARRLGLLEETSLGEHHSGPYLLHDSELGATRAAYADDQREEFDEMIDVFSVEVAPGWGEIAMPSQGARAAIGEVRAMIRTHERDWEFSELMRNLFTTLDGSIVAISIPAEDGRVIWMPLLTLVSGMLTLGERRSVRMRRCLGERTAPSDPGT